MNGIITELPSRSTHRNPLTSKQVVSSIAAGVCLFGGFIAGFNISHETVERIARLNPLHTETLDFSKIGWVHPVEVHTITAQNAEISPVNVDFTPYVLDTSHPVKSYAPKRLGSKKRLATFRELQLAYAKFQKAMKYQPRSRDSIYADYQAAIKKLRLDFIAATDIAAKPEVMMAKASAPVTPAIAVASVTAPQASAKKEIPSAQSPFRPAIIEDAPIAVEPVAQTATPIAKVEAQPVAQAETLSIVQSSAEPVSTMKRWKPAPKKRPDQNFHAKAPIATVTKKTKRAEKIQDSAEVQVVNDELTPTQVAELAAAQLSDQPKTESSVAEQAVAMKQTSSPAKVAEVTEVTYPEAAIMTTRVDTQPMNIQNAAPQKEETLQVKQTSSSADLTDSEKQKLAESLLAVQFENKNLAQVQAVAPIIASAKAAAKARQEISTKREEQPVDTTELQKERDYLNDANELHSLAMAKHTAGSGCSVLVGHSFIKPNPQMEDGVDTQICPEHKMWISKNWNEKGWVKVDGSEHLSTLTMHPAANGGSTLLLDQNALALIAVKAGVRVAQGAGVIVGLVPQGFKVEFAGRGEETQYFELNKKRYFAVINAEPGAGVIELVSEQDQNLSSTVFTPVMEDTMTYLDLVTPQKRNLGVQVVKSGIENDPQVVGLTVGISTQGSVQAITQSNGRTILKNVSLVNGYPVFLDVSSKTEQGEGSYTYRYQIKQKNKQGYYVVNQINERTLYKWLKQVKHGLSDQSAMVVGFYNRKILDGFKNNYTTRTEPKSARFGLDPLNYSILWNGEISTTEPLEGDLPRFMSVQVPEGLSQVQLINEANQIANAQLIPVSPRVIHVISE